LLRKQERDGEFHSFSGAWNETFKLAFHQWDFFLRYFSAFCNQKCFDIRCTEDDAIGH